MATGASSSWGGFFEESSSEDSEGGTRSDVSQDAMRANRARIQLGTGYIATRPGPPEGCQFWSRTLWDALHDIRSARGPQQHPLLVDVHNAGVLAPEIGRQARGLGYIRLLF